MLFLKAKWNKVTCTMQLLYQWCMKEGKLTQKELVNHIVPGRLSILCTNRRSSMSCTLIIKEEAVADIIEAYSYCEAQLVGQGTFFRRIKEAYKELWSHPHYYSFIEEDTKQILRNVRLNESPYLLIFEISDDEVSVYAVDNINRNPKRKVRKR